MTEEQDILKNSTIVIVEDETALLELYKMVFEEAGSKIITAEEGDSGIEAIKNNDWDLLLLDIMLPNTDGINVIKKLNEEFKNKSWKKGKVVMLTNLNNEDIIKTSFNLGIDGYLIKSEIQPDQLLNEARAFLKGEPVF
jgi:DNA-binding response OmpR family regulator